jgi:hypothetical protein
MCSLAFFSFLLSTFSIHERGIRLLSLGSRAFLSSFVTQEEFSSFFSSLAASVPGQPVGPLLLGLVEGVHVLAGHPLPLRVLLDDG